jgi:hypothetical protein
MGAYDIPPREEWTLLDEGTVALLELVFGSAGMLQLVVILGFGLYTASAWCVTVGKRLVREPRH